MDNLTYQNIKLQSLLNINRHVSKAINKTNLLKNILTELIFSWKALQARIFLFDENKNIQHFAELNKEESDFLDLKGENLSLFQCSGYILQNKEAVNIPLDLCKRCIFFDGNESVKRFSIGIKNQDLLIGGMIVAVPNDFSDEEASIFLSTVDNDLVQGIKRLDASSNIDVSMKEIKNTNETLDYLLNVFKKPFLNKVDFFEHALQSAIDITKSKIGIIYDYNQDKNKFSLKVFSFANGQPCKISSKEVREKGNNEGAWFETIYKREPIIINDFSKADSFRSSFPNGHAKVSRFLSSPVIRDNKIVAVIGVANKDTNYTQSDASKLNMFIGYIWNSLDLLNANLLLHESENKYQMLFNSITDAIFVSDMERRIVDCNPRFSELFGYNKEEILGKKKSLLYESSTDFFTFGELLRNNFNDQKKIKKVVNYKKKNGEIFQGETIVYYLKDSQNSVMGFVGLIRNVSKEISYQSKIEVLLKQKDILLKEVHHRLKNNMNTVAGILELNSGTVKNEEARDVLFDSSNRLKSMVSIYNNLYCSDDFENINLKILFEEIIEKIIATYSTFSEGIKVKKNIEDISIPSKKAFSLVILLNELISNSLKYAFQDFNSKDKQISISAIKNKDSNEMFFSLWDNGNGPDETIDKDSMDNFGMFLIHQMVIQLKGSIEYKQDNGFETQIVFPLD